MGCSPSPTLQLVLGDDPNKLFFDQVKMRRHLYQCLEKLLPFPHEEKQTSSEESGLLRRLLHLQNARSGRGREVGRMHQVLEIVPHGQMSEHFSNIFRR